jgi:hypothetical protein
MRCTACGAELILTNVVPDDTVAVRSLDAVSQSIGYCSSKLVVRLTDCSSNLRRETMLAPQALALPQQRGSLVFHGLSYEYIAGRLPEVAPEIASGRVIVVHLGSGASMRALAGGRSIESTMGFTALDGLPTGTRPGQVDPGVVLYLIEQKGMSAAEVQKLFYYECGLKGLSGINDREVVSLVKRRICSRILRLCRSA